MEDVSEFVRVFCSSGFMFVLCNIHTELCQILQCSVMWPL